MSLPPDPPELDVPDLTIVVRNANLEPVEIVDQFDVLEWSERWLGVGGWILTLSSYSPAAQALAAPGAGIVVVNSDGDVELSGPCLPSLEGAGQAATRRVAALEGFQSDQVTYVGTCDNVWIRDRITVPPSGATDDRSGTASSVMIGYLTANTAGARAIPNLATPVDPILGSSIDYSARYAQLDEVLAACARLGGLTYKLAQTNRQLVLTIAEPVDRSASVRFGFDLFNLASGDVITSPALATVGYFAGQGEGAARTIEIVEAAGAATRRIERFIDRRDVDSAAGLAAVGAVWLEDNAGSLVVTGTPVDTADVVFGRDYRVGDLVSLDVAGALSTPRVAEVTTRLDAGGVTRTVSLGSEQSGGTVSLLRTQAALAGRLDLIERT